MKLGDTKWRTLVSSVRLRGKEYRVIRPARPITHAPLYEGWHGAQLTVNKAATVDLAFAWWLAARSRHSLVHLPLRSTDYTCGEAAGAPRLDLVLLHHSLAFPVSRWKELRARLPAGAPHTVHLPAQPSSKATLDYTVRWRRDFRDHLRWDIAADTLFLTGSRGAFEYYAGQVRALAENCPAHRAENPEAHCCAEIDVGRPWRLDRRRPSAMVHVECCRDHW